MGFRDMMNNYFYGKQGKADYTVEMMPTNRRQLFGEVLKVRWSSLFGMNLLYMVFWLPAIIWTLMNASAILSMADPEAGATGEQLLGLINAYLVILFPCIAITGPFNAGLTYVLRNWARDEHSFPWSDFWQAVRENWKQSLVLSIISGALPCILFTCWQFYSGMLAKSVLFVVPIGLVMLVGVVWSLSSMVAYTMLVTYDLKLKNVIRNSILLTLAKLPQSVAIKLLTLAIPAAAFGLMLLLPNYQMQILLVIGMLYLVFLVAFHKLITVSYANWLCETYLNTRIEGARTNIGLRPENWDDVTYIPEDDEE